MQKFLKQLEVLKSQIDQAYKKLGIDNKQTEISQAEETLSQPQTWQDHNKMQELNQRMAEIKNIVEPWQELKKQTDELIELSNLNDSSLTDEIEEQIQKLESKLNNLRKQLLFSGEYDQYGVILRLSAGVGGTDAQDFTEMLERMYLRWAEKAGMETKIINKSSGDEAGIKSSDIEVSGPFAYGKLRSENGVHRLVRLSPFNSDNLRQTSFALVEVLPKIDKPEDVELNDKDIKIDVFRAGGHGGQSVNTTDSAVRVTHLPTGITVAIQNERSQLQNKETALKILRSKLMQLKINQHLSSIAELQAGESANWGSQIRNYVLHPYTLVKDTRTKHETNNAQAVLDGDIDGFITAYLEQNQSDTP